MAHHVHVMPPRRQFPRPRVRTEVDLVSAVVAYQQNFQLAVYQTNSILTA
jgi:hypothetical protein